MGNLLKQNMEEYRNEMVRRIKDEKENSSHIEIDQYKEIPYFGLNEYNSNHKKDVLIGNIMVITSTLIIFLTAKYVSKNIGLFVLGVCIYLASHIMILIPIIDKIRYDDYSKCKKCGHKTSAIPHNQKGGLVKYFCSQCKTYFVISRLGPE